MSWMKRWFMRSVLTVGDLGEWHGKKGYPNDQTFVEIPLYSLTPSGDLNPSAMSRDDQIRVVRLGKGQG